MIGASSFRSSVARVAVAVAAAAATAGAITLVASTAQAQVAAKQFSVVTRLGSVAPERAASLNPGGYVGVDAEYSFNKYFGLGTTLGVSRNQTHREDFLTALRFGNPSVSGGDSIYYQFVGQPVNLVDLTGFAIGRLPMGRFTPYAMGGVGTYTLIADAQVAGQAKRKNDISLTGGAGFWYRLTDRAGIQIDGRLLQMRNYSRAFLDPTGGRNRNVSFPEDFVAPPAAKNTANAAVLTLGFRYIPGNIGGGN
jgi:opacity protein-like surface antigen